MQEENKKNEESKEDEERRRRRADKFKSELNESSIWILLALMVIVPEVLIGGIRSYSLRDIILDNYSKVLLSVFVLIIPSIFKLTFGEYPFEYLRNRQKAKLEYNKYKFINTDSVIPKVIKEYKLKDEHIEQKNKEITYAELYIKESKEIAETIFARSGVYLIVGCMVAFAGVGIFFSPIFKISESRDVTQTLIEYLPRFGSLFFIEFVAIFFLKQSKIMLEEYRYYESIKRKRQDHFNFIFLLEKYKDNSEILKIIVEKGDQSVSTKLSNGDTTEILESHKIINSELDIFSKFTDLIKVIKSKEI